MYSIYHNLKIGDSKCWKLSDNMKLVNGYKKRYGTMHIDIFSYEKKILIQKVWKCVGNTADYWCLKNVQVTIVNNEKWPVTWAKWYTTWPSDCGHIQVCFFLRPRSLGQVTSSLAISDRSLFIVHDCDLDIFKTSIICCVPHTFSNFLYHNFFFVWKHINMYCSIHFFVTIH